MCCRTKKLLFEQFFSICKINLCTLKQFFFNLLSKLLHKGKLLKSTHFFITVNKRLFLLQCFCATTHFSKRSSLRLHEIFWVIFNYCVCRYTAARSNRRTRIIFTMLRKWKWWCTYQLKTFCFLMLAERQIVEMVLLT